MFVTSAKPCFISIMKILLRSVNIHRELVFKEVEKAMRGQPRAGFSEMESAEPELEKVFLQSVEARCFTRKSDERQMEHHI